jgi:hypothetical protein
MLFYIFHLIFILGWLFDFLIIIYCIKKFLNLSILCLIYPIIYVFVEYFECMVFFEYLSKLYLNSYKSYFKYEFHESIKIESNEKKELILLGPHGMFITAPISFGVFGFNREEVKTFKIFTAPILARNPFINFFAKMLQNGNKIEALTHKNVVRLMKENEYNLGVCSGGFEEINCYYDNKNVIYTGRWEYWFYNAIKYGYNITFSYSYGGTQDYKSLLGSWNLKFRNKLAKMQIPFNFVYGKYLIFPFNNVTMTNIIYRIDKLPYNPNVTRNEAKYYCDLYKEKIIKKVLDIGIKNRENKEEKQDEIVFI